jgi:hypothetical protein
MIVGAGGVKKTLFGQNYNLLLLFRSKKMMRFLGIREFLRLATGGIILSDLKIPVTTPYLLY